MAGVYRADRVALNFYDFCDFSIDPQKYVHPNKNHHKHFSRKNLLQSTVHSMPDKFESGTLFFWLRAFRPH